MNSSQNRTWNSQMLKEKRVEVEGGISKPQYRSIHVSGLCGFLNQSYWLFPYTKL